MQTTWAEFFYDWWWTIFPVLWFGWSAYRSYLQYRYRRGKLELLGKLAQSGRDVPADVLRVLQTDDAPSGQFRRYVQWRRAIIFGALAIGFALTHHLNPARYEGFDFVAILLGCVSASYLIYILALRNPDDK